MPNWCFNSLTISGGCKNRRDALIRAFENGKFLETVVPVPASKERYEFCSSNWGTKWDVEGDVEDRTDDSVTFIFDSAWDPPIPVYQRLLLEGFKVRAFYHEPGMCFVGAFNSETGEDSYYDYGCKNPDEIEEFIGKELYDQFDFSYLDE